MRTMGFAAVALISAATQLFACSSGDTVVVANLRSSNDTQYNGDTRTGSYGGLLDPGIPQNILHPEVAGSPTTLRKAVKVRITVTQGTATVTRDVVPTPVTFQADVLDANGMPVPDLTSDAATPPNKKATHSAIAPSFERFILPSGFKGGETTVTADALDDQGQAFFSAVKSTIDLTEGEATAAFLDFKIPSPAAPPVSDAGSGSDAAEGGGAATDARTGADGASPDARAATDAGADVGVTADGGVPADAAIGIDVTDARAIDAATGG
jgi:hypothetical protein